MKAREAAFSAVFASLKGEGFIQDTLQQWQNREHPSPQDFHFVQEIAYGSARMALSLDNLAKQLCESGKLNLKLIEKVLLRTAVYQFYYMDRVPIYAIVDESVQIAQKQGRQNFARFLNATLRKMPQTSLYLPKGDGVADLSIRYSYPPFFVEQLLQDYDLPQVIAILESMNHAAPTTVRIRTPTLAKQPIEGLRLLVSDPFPIAILDNSALLPRLASSPDYYIQNRTPATLIGKLCQQLPLPPQAVLDVCASPGGKMIAVHDYFPKAELFGNDISPEKLEPIRENLKKYSIEAALSCSPGESLNLNQQFDLIILDVPCTNSGVLHKRPEARWRLTEEACTDLEVTQRKLLEQAFKLLKPSGHIFYLTCSILKRENEELIERICQQNPSHSIQFTETILPHAEAWDGGFAALIKQHLFI